MRVFFSLFKSDVIQYINRNINSPFSRSLSPHLCWCCWFYSVLFGIFHFPLFLQCWTTKQIYMRCFFLNTIKTVAICASTVEIFLLQFTEIKWNEISVFFDSLAAVNTNQIANKKHVWHRILAHSLHYILFYILSRWRNSLETGVCVCDTMRCVYILMKFFVCSLLFFFCFVVVFFSKYTMWKQVQANWIIIHFNQNIDEFRVKAVNDFEDDP